MKTTEEWYKEFHDAGIARLEKLKAQRDEIDKQIKQVEELLMNIPDPYEDN